MQDIRAPMPERDSQTHARTRAVSCDGGDGGRRGRGCLKREPSGTRLELGSKEAVGALSPFKMMHTAAVGM